MLQGFKKQARGGPITRPPENHLVATQEMWQTKPGNFVHFWAIPYFPGARTGGDGKVPRQEGKKITPHNFD